MKFHPRRPQQRTDRFGCATLASNYFPQVFGMNSQFQNSDLRAFHRLDLYSLGMINERSSNLLHEFFHRAPACVPFVELPRAPLHRDERATNLRHWDLTRKT